MSHLCAVHSDQIINTRFVPDCPTGTIPAADAEETPQFRVKKRFALQRGAKYLLDNNKALQGCCSWLQKSGDGVPLYSYPELRKARFGNVQTCASVWACPICSAKISERRRSWELVPGLAAARAKGWSVLLVTYTLRHQSEDRLRALMQGLIACRKSSRSGKRMERLRDRYGIEGSIRVFEVTHGANGWHPHIHELMFLSKEYDRAALLADLSKQWSDGVRLAGLRSVNEHGVKISDAHKKIEEYVTKFGRDPKWGLAEEVSKQQVKKARSDKGRAPFQLLADYTFQGDLQAGVLFREYADAMFRKKQMYWSPGLKAALGVKEMSDAQIEAMEEQEKKRLTMDHLSDPEWAVIRADDMVGDLWNAVAAGDKPALDAFLAPYRSTCTNRNVTIKDAVQLVDWSADDRDLGRTLADDDPFVSDRVVQRLLRTGVSKEEALRVGVSIRDMQSDPFADLFDPALAAHPQPVVIEVMKEERQERAAVASMETPWRVVKRSAPCTSLLDHTDMHAGRDAWSIELRPEYFGDHVDNWR